MPRRLTLLVPIALAVAVGTARAQSETPIDRIEEDWELVIGTPDLAGAGPQVSTAMSPVPDRSSPFFIFDVNYRDAPDFAPGGIQAQVWKGNFMLSSVGMDSAQCVTTGEVITWTQRMRISSGRIYFAVVDGNSTTWGKFGQGNQLTVDAEFATPLTSLDRYTPESSVTSSGVGWEPNRVASIKITQIRYYAAGKLLRTDSTVRSIELDD